MAILAMAVLLTTVVQDVWQRSGAIAGCLVAAAILTSLFFPAPLAWLRVTRLIAGAVLTVCGALLTLMLGYAVEHPSSDDPFLGGLMMATLLAFLATLATDLRMHVLESRAAKDLERDAVERHDALLAVLAAQDRTHARVAPARAMSSVLITAAVGVFAGMALARKRN
ncbi:hypothetical protein FA014_02770 [Cellulomonas hominis]|uniref:Uncharacterized protein n=1 Tax=Cellulomonas hominis TaxID=156981 RepID=A0A7Z8K1F4_9CELL|nr:hypothetical protein [Cellulomonas hominis]TKR27009.1 hypothetical protein FA014_02770 [Cellulomonas hominis]